MDIQDHLQQKVKNLNSFKLSTACSLTVTPYYSSNAEFLLQFLAVMSDAKKPKRKRKFFSLTCITMLAFENNFI